MAWLKRRTYNFTFELYCEAIDKCLNEISKLQANYNPLAPYYEIAPTLAKLNKWSELNYKLVVRRNRELFLGWHESRKSDA
jgi:hypothetical protein